MGTLYKPWIVIVASRLARGREKDALSCLESVGYHHR